VSQLDLSAKTVDKYPQEVRTLAKKSRQNSTKIQMEPQELPPQTIILSDQLSDQM
jgi:hypothetical protein